jgi:L-rhamnose mutarotase
MGGGCGGCGGCGGGGGGSGSGSGGDAPATVMLRPQEYTGGGQLTKKGRKRICFTMAVSPSELPTYVMMHKMIPPELQQTLMACGWHNYSLFHRADGQIFGYYETDNVNHEESCRKRRESAVDLKWQESMREFTAGEHAFQYETHEVLEHCFYLGNDRKWGW